MRWFSLRAGGRIGLAGLLFRLGVLLGGFLLRLLGCGLLLAHGVLLLLREPSRGRARPSSSPARSSWRAASSPARLSRPSWRLSPAASAQAAAPGPRQSWRRGRESGSGSCGLVLADGDRPHV